MALSKEQRKAIAEKFEELRANYQRHWLVKDTQAFEQFCFKYSDQISEMLKKAARR